MKRITIEITFKGETRTVEASYNESTRVAYVDGFVAQIGAGTARYPATASCAQNEDGSWRMGTHVIVRNRTARIIGWADVVAITNHADQTRAEAPVADADDALVTQDEIDALGIDNRRWEGPVTRREFNEILSTRCAEHPAYDADYCPLCGTAREIGQQPEPVVDATPLVLINGASKSGTYGVWAKGDTRVAALAEFNRQGGGVRHGYSVVTFPAGEPSTLLVGPMGVEWRGAAVEPIVEQVAKRR